MPTSRPGSSLTTPDGQHYQRLLDAVLTVGSGEPLEIVLGHLVEIATGLVDADRGDLLTGGQERPTGPEVLAAQVWAGRAFVGTLSVQRSPGQAFSANDRQALAAVAVLAGLAVRTARRGEDSRRREAWMEAGRDVSTSLLSGTEPEQVMALVADRVREVLATDVACVVVARDGELVIEATSTGPAVTVDAASRLLGPLADSLRQVLTTGRPLEVTAASLVGTAVPLGPSDRQGGGALVALWSERPDPLTTVDLTGFGAQAAVALELAERRREAERFAIVEDRNRIGRDLHDLVIQRLFATGLQLQRAVAMVDAHPQEASARVNRAVDELDDTIRQLRSTISGLQAPVTGAPSLRARLVQVVDGASEALGFSPAVRLEGLLDTVVLPEMAEHTLATLSEALSNVVRHACARRVDVGVVVRRGWLVLRVDDDGAGPPSAAEPLASGHTGLRNLADRAATLGGSLQVTRAPTGGTRLQWQVPL